MDQNAYPIDIENRLRVYGERIRAARGRRRWTRKDLAVRLGVERRTVARLEGGHPGIALGVFLNALWILGLWETAEAVASPEADRVGLFLEKKRQPKRIRREAEKELDF